MPKGKKSGKSTIDSAAIKAKQEENAARVARAMKMLQKTVPGDRLPSPSAYRKPETSSSSGAGIGDALKIFQLFQGQGGGGGGTTSQGFGSMGGGEGLGYKKGGSIKKGVKKGAKKHKSVKKRAALRGQRSELRGS